MDPKVIVFFSAIFLILTQKVYIQGISGKLAFITKNLSGRHHPQAGFLLGVMKL